MFTPKNCGIIILKKKMKINEGDFALIEWNGSAYFKSQHYHIVEVNKNNIKVRVPGSYINLVILKKNIINYEIKEL